MGHLFPLDIPSGRAPLLPPPLELPADFEPRDRLPPLGGGWLLFLRGLSSSESSDRGERSRWPDFFPGLEAIPPFSRAFSRPRLSSSSAHACNNRKRNHSIRKNYGGLTSASSESIPSEESSSSDISSESSSEYSLRSESSESSCVMRLKKPKKSRKTWMFAPQTSHRYLRHQQ